MYFFNDPLWNPKHDPFGRDRCHGTSRRLAHEDFDEEQRRLLLRFCTGSSRVPPGGFQELQPNFTVDAWSVGDWWRSRSVVGRRRRRGMLKCGWECFDVFCMVGNGSWRRGRRAFIHQIRCVDSSGISVADSLDMSFR